MPLKLSQAWFKLFHWSFRAVTWIERLDQFWFIVYLYLRFALVYCRVLYFSLPFISCSWYFFVPHHCMQFSCGFPSHSHPLRNKHHFYQTKAVIAEFFNPHLPWAQSTSHLPAKGEIKPAALWSPDRAVQVSRCSLKMVGKRPFIGDNGETSARSLLRSAGRQSSLSRYL